MEDRRAHERIDIVEHTLDDHIAEHSRFEKALLENTVMTAQIANNTAELVTLVKGAKSLRAFAVWATPLILAIAALIAWVRNE